MSRLELTRARRRTVLWTVPVVAAVAPSPAFAASACTPPSMAFNATWTKGGSPATFVADGDNGVTTHWDSTQRFWAWADNTNTDNTSCYITYSKSLTLTSGVTYTFTTDVASDYGNNNSANSSEARLTFTIGGTSKYVGSTKTPAPPGVSSLGTPASGQGRTTVTFTHTPTTTGAVTFQIQIQVFPRGTKGFSDDIGVAPPVVTC